jgi:hypothetical protein
MASVMLIFCASAQAEKLLVQIQIQTSGYLPVLRMFLGLQDPDPLVRGTHPDPASDPSIIKQKK